MKQLFDLFEAAYQQGYRYSQTLEKEDELVNFFEANKSQILDMLASFTAETFLTLKNETHENI